MIHFTDAIFDSNNKLIKDGLWLDCYENRWNNKCKASLANSCTNAMRKLEDGTMVTNIENCDIVIDRHNRRVRLKACSDIPLGMEIITNYNVRFQR